MATDGSKEDQERCIFCRISSGRLPAFIVHRDEQCSIIMDIFPLSPGHVLIIPHDHVKTIEELSAPAREHIFQMASEMSAAFRQGRLNAKATHVLLNNGPGANQHIPHVHLHVIPRHDDDGYSFRWKAGSYGEGEMARWRDRIAAALET